MLKIDAATLTEESILDTGDAAYTNGLSIDSSQNFLYGATRNNIWGFSQEKIGKINLQTFTLDTDTITSQRGWTEGALDKTTGFLYFGDKDRGDFIKVDSGTLTLVGTIPAATASTNTVLIDETNQMGYISGEHWTPLGSEIAKIDLQTFTKIGSQRLPEPNNPVYYGAIDTQGDRLYLAAGWPAKLHTLRISDFSYVKELSFIQKLEALETLEFSNDTGILYGGIYAYPGYMTGIATTQKGMIHGTKVTLGNQANIVNALRFYSHQAGGNIRLGLYNAQIE